MVACEEPESPLFREEEKNMIFKPDEPSLSYQVKPQEEPVIMIDTSKNDRKKVSSKSSDLSSEHQQLVNVDYKDSENSSSIFKSDLNYYGQDNYDQNNQYDQYGNEDDEEQEYEDAINRMKSALGDEGPADWSLERAII